MAPTGIVAAGPPHAVGVAAPSVEAEAEHYLVAVHELLFVQRGVVLQVRRQSSETRDAVLGVRQGLAGNGVKVSGVGIEKAVVMSCRFQSL